MIISRRYLLLISVCAIWLAGCTLYRKPVVPALNQPTQFKVKLKVSGTHIKNNWWESFHDQHLNKLVKVALQNNLTYQVALKNIDVAATYVSQNFSGLFPQVGLGFNSSRNKSAEAIFNTTGSVAAVTPNNSGRSALFNLQQLSGTVSYQLDIWNQIRNSVRQAEANQAVSEADSEAAKLTLITSVVGTYFQIQAAHVNLSNLRKQRSAVVELLSLYRSQYRGGLVDYTVVIDTKSQLDMLNATISSVEKQAQILQFSLATLLGEYPERVKLKTSPGFAVMLVVI